MASIPKRRTIYLDTIGTVDNQASDTRYYNDYKPIRNALRKYDPVSVMYAVLQYLYGPVHGKLDRLGRHPWIGMLLIKWAFIDEQAGLKGRPAITPQKFGALYRAAIDLGGSTNGPNSYPNISMFVRSVAYQQFLYQRDENIVGIARQELLFASADSTLSKSRFLAATGVSIPNFLRLLLCTMLQIMQTRAPEMDQSWFQFLYQDYPAAEVEAFLHSISIRVEDLPATLRASDRLGRTIPEYNAPTPFISHPLVRIGSRYFCVYPEILQKACEHFVYDKLKKLNDSKIDRAFGTAFEKYVGDRLLETELPLAAEADLERLLNGSGKLIDFLVTDAGANVFVEAKGVEMAVTGMATTRQGDIKNATENSLRKAIRQAYEVNARLAANGEAHPVIQYRPDSYLLVITYKELYIHNGAALREAIGVQSFDALGEGIAPQNLIPPENMYFLTIEELEHFVEFVKVRKPGLVDGIERAKADDAQVRVSTAPSELG